MLNGNSKVLLIIQVIFVLYDLLANLCVDFFTKSGLIQLVLMVFQNIILAMSILLVFLSIFSTYPTQVSFFFALRSIFISLSFLDHLQFSFLRFS